MRYERPTCLKWTEIIFPCLVSFLNIHPEPRRRVNGTVVDPSSDPTLKSYTVMGAGASGQKAGATKDKNEEPVANGSLDSSASSRNLGGERPPQLKHGSPLQSETSLQDFGRGASDSGSPGSPVDARRWTMPPRHFEQERWGSKEEMESIKESLRRVSRESPAHGRRLPSPQRGERKRGRRFSTGNARKVVTDHLKAGHVHHDNVYSTGLMEAVKGRMRLAKRETQSDVDLTAAQLVDPHRTLAAAELFNMITRQFKLPALTDAAKDYAMQRLTRHADVVVGHIIINQGSPDISKLYIMTAGKTLECGLTLGASVFFPLCAN